MTLQREDLSGRIFGKLTVLGPAPSRRYGGKGRIRHFWRCRCSCGRECEAGAQRLRNGQSVSCGCTRGFRREPGESARDQVIYQYQVDAKRNGRAFELSEACMMELFVARCFYCGVPPSTTTNKPDANGQFTYNGIDRYDNEIGYVASNVVSCCAECNRRKGTTHGDDFIAWILRAAAHQTRSSAAA